MSSGGWEIVGKKNKDKNNGKATKLTKAEKKNFIMNSPKLEDFLPLNEVKSLYDSLDGNKENKRPSKEKDNKSKENEEKKKQQKLKQQQQQQAEKNKKQQQQKTKEKSPKEKSSNGINVDELNELLENDKLKFPDAPLIWLKDMVSYLDAKIPAEKDELGFLKQPETYPLSFISKAVRTSLEKTIKVAGAENAQLCWEGTLATMVKNISNGSSDLGCKIFLQLLAQTNPEMTAANLPKLASLRNSYQNKKSIGMSLLWAFAQSGKKHLAIGLTVWHEIMAPMLESRTYASYVLKILRDFLSASKNSNHLTADRFFDLVDDLYAGKIHLPAHLDNDVTSCMELLRLQMVKSESINLPKIFETLMGKVSPKVNSKYREEIIKSLVACVTADSRCLSVWTSLYPKNLYQSDLLLKQLLADWNTLRAGVETKPFKETLETFRTMVVTSKKGKEENLVLSCSRTSEALVEKMSASKKKRSSFPFKTGIIVLLVLIGAVVTYDCQKHGSYEASSTGTFLKNSGLANYGHNAAKAVVHCKDTSLTYLKTNYPDYYKISAEFGEKYSRLFGDLYLITKNLIVKASLNLAKFVTEKKPLVTENIEYYFPGLLDNLHKRSLIEIERVKTYSAIIQEHVTVQTIGFVRWLETNVFVGNLSPQNMRGYATQAVEKTQNLASQTYDWVYEKVQTLSKVH
ncbi:transmembrane protein 214-A [Venturia canescens]|uniref:transmembrane protein 214-A n=1 Tax=Venturia canescens TaxID=32260 RepID=UPI001C9C4173|nr:transmembrane protein 214-A [Venturia canescens]